MNNRYVVFAGSDYYPLGGAKDFHSSHSDASKAIIQCQSLVTENYLSWAHTWDLLEFKIVFECENPTPAQLVKWKKS